MGKWMAVWGFGAVFGATALMTASAQDAGPTDAEFAHLTLEGPAATVPALMSGHPHAPAPGFEPIAFAPSQARSYTPPDVVGTASFKVDGNTLVHGNSGMNCPGVHALNLKDTGEMLLSVQLFRVTVFDPNGDDVACAYIDDAGSLLITVFASNWPGVSVDDHFASATQIMVTKETPFAEQVKIPVMAPTDQAKTTLAGDTKAVAYDGQPASDGRVKREALWLNKARGWHIKVRATHLPPAERPLILGMFAHARAVEDIALDSGTLSNRLVNAPGTMNELARTISWSQP